MNTSFLSKKTFMGLMVVLVVAIQPSKPTRVVNLKIEEPSGFCLSKDEKTIFLVSDNGYLAKAQFNKETLELSNYQKAQFRGVDFEAAYCDDKFLYVVEERLRNIKKFDFDLNLLSSQKVSYLGGKNKGYESIAFNQKENKFYLITEHSPIWIVETDAEFNVKNTVEFKYDRDISDAYFYDGFLWLLSDENYEILKLNPKDYSILGRQKIRVLNPEGLAIIGNKALVVSDNMQKLFEFGLKIK